MKKVYLSGPISGYDINERKKHFYEAQIAFEQNGYEVFNPMLNGLPQDARTVDHMRVDMKMLCECDTIAMLPKWNHSAGCVKEFQVGVAIGCNVLYVESLQPELKVCEPKMF